MVKSNKGKKGKNAAKKLQKVDNETDKQVKLEELKQAIRIQASKRSELDKKWRNMMQQIKTPVLQNDIKAMCLGFERVNDKKDKLITHMISQIDDSENNQRKALISCFDTIDVQIKNFHFNIEELSNSYNEHANIIVKQGTNDTAYIKNINDTAEYHLQLLLFHSKTKANAASWAKRGKYMARTHEDAQVSKDQIANLRLTLDGACNSIWDSIKLTIKNYIHNTVKQRNLIKLLRRDDRRMSDIIATQDLQLKDNDSLVHRLKKELFTIESGKKQTDIRQRRDGYRKACAAMKKQINDTNASDNNILDFMVQCSSDAVDRLKRLNKKCVKAYSLIALNRKFETHKEKILPMGPNCDAGRVIERPSVKNLRKSQDSQSAVTHDSVFDVMSLMQRISNVNLITKALKKEKQVLLEENAMLLRELRHGPEYYDEVIPVGRKYQHHPPSIDGRQFKLPCINIKET